MSTRTILILVCIAVAACSSAATSSGNDGGDGGIEHDASASDAESLSDAGPTMDARVRDANAAETSSDGGTGDADAGFDCTALVNGGAPVALVYVAAAAPAPTGGVIADGTYFLTAETVYTGSGGKSGTDDAGAGIGDQETIAFSGNAMQRVIHGAGTPPGEYRSASTIAVSGTTFTSTLTCGGSTVSSHPYSATVTTFSRASAIGTYVLVFTYTKQ